GEFGEHWQRQHLARCAFGLRERTLAISEIAQWVLLVQRHRVIDLGSYAAAGEELAQVVAPRGADDVLMEDVVRFRRGAQQPQRRLRSRLRARDESGLRQQAVVNAGALPPRFIPALAVAQLRGEHTPLDGMDPRVPAYLFVVIADAAAVIAQPPQA